LKKKTPFWPPTKARQEEDDLSSSYRQAFRAFKTQVRAGEGRFAWTRDLLGPGKLSHVQSLSV
jgi:hypothetical protein